MSEQHDHICPKCGTPCCVHLGIAAETDVAFGITASAIGAARDATVAITKSGTGALGFSASGIAITDEAVGHDSVAKRHIVRTDVFSTSMEQWTDGHLIGKLHIGDELWWADSYIGPGAKDRLLLDAAIVMSDRLPDYDA